MALCGPCALRSGVLHQSIAHRRLGQNVLWLRGIVLEFLPQMSHVYTNIVAILGMRGSPYLAQDLSMRQHFAGIRDQKTEQAVLDRGQMNRDAGLVRGSQAQIDTDVA